MAPTNFGCLGSIYLVVLFFFFPRPIKSHLTPRTTFLIVSGLFCVQFGLESISNFNSDWNSDSDSDLSSSSSSPRLGEVKSKSQKNMGEKKEI